jgi:hypothetical protein
LNAFSFFSPLSITPALSSTAFIDRYQHLKAVWSFVTSERKPMLTLTKKREAEVPQFRWTMIEPLRPFKDKFEFGVDGKPLKIFQGNMNFVRIPPKTLKNTHGTKILLQAIPLACLQKLLKLLKKV